MIFHTLGYSDGALCHGAPVATHFRDMESLKADAPLWIKNYQTLRKGFDPPDARTIHIVKVSTQVQGQAIEAAT